MRFLRMLYRRYLAADEFTCAGGYGEIWKIAWPLIAMSASSIILLIINRIFLARHQLEDVTAAVPAGQLFFTLQVFFLVTCSFSGTIASQFFGKKDYASCVRSTWNSFYFSSAMGLLLIPFLPWLGEQLLNFGQLSDSIRCRQIDYFSTLAPCAALSCIEASFFSYFTAIGRTKSMGAIKIISCVLGLPLNYILIYGKCGMPEFGIIGAALATTGTVLISTVAVIVLFLVQRDPRFPVWKNLHFRMEIARKLIVFGTPGGVQAFSRSCGMAFVIMMISRMGDQAMASASITMTLNQLSFIPLFGLCDATSILTGRYIGARQPGVVNRIPFRAIRILMIYFGIIALLFIFQPDRLLQFFQSSAASELDFHTVAENVKIIMLLLVAQNLFDGIRFVIMGSLRGAGDTRVPLLLALSTTLLVQLPGTLIAINWLHLPLGGTWFCAITLYVFVDCMLILWRRNTGAWKKIRVIDLDAPSEAA